VVPLPNPTRQVGAKAGQGRSDVAKSGEGRDRASHFGAEIGLGSAPIGAEKAIRAVAWDWQLGDLEHTEVPANLVQRGEELSIDRQNLR
jgi:hypothetical protein